MSRPRDLSSASLAPRCTSEAVKVAVAVAVAQWQHLVGVSSWVFFPRSQPPELAVGTGFTHQAPPLSCSSVPPVADAQGDSYTSSLATPELRRNGRLAADRRDSGKMARCRKADFPAQIG